MDQEFVLDVRQYVRKRLFQELGLLPGGKLPTLKNRIDAMADQASAGCGSSFDVFQMKLSGMIDAAFSQGSPDHVAAIEYTKGVYASPHEIEANQKQLAEMGYCSHGLDPYCCPCGCGDLD